MYIIYEHNKVDNEEFRNHISDTPALHKYFKQDWDGLKAKQYCGIINYKDNDIYILPKISKRQEKINLNLFIYLVLYAYDIKIENEQVASCNNEKNTFIEILIQSFAKKLLKEFQLDVYKKYITQQDNLTVLRGKYLINENCKFNYIKNKIYCEYDEFSENNRSVKVFKKHKIRNIILYGAPGVGKTHNTKKLIHLIEKEQSEKKIFDEIENNGHHDGLVADKIIDDISHRVKFITFHQSYSYEDFIEGFRPDINGKIELKKGLFQEIVKDASGNKNEKYYLIIDEINRGNISKIFGELITLLEEDKRDTYKVTLPYSGKDFSVPSNLYIIATMNSTDKSIATIDIALRRRFTFLKMKPQIGLIDDAGAKKIFLDLNSFIEKFLGEDYQIGHSYFMGDDIDLEFIKKFKIKPLLEEYFFADKDHYDEALKILNQ